jgi:hypothetical protein
LNTLSRKILRIFSPHRFSQWRMQGIACHSKMSTAVFISCHLECDGHLETHISHWLRFSLPQSHVMTDHPPQDGQIQIGQEWIQIPINLRQGKPSYI